VLEHPDKARYSGQLLYEVDVEGYVYVVPVARKEHIIFLEIVSPSRKATRQRRKGETE